MSEAPILVTQGGRMRLEEPRTDPTYPVAASMLRGLVSAVNEARDYADELADELQRSRELLTRLRSALPASHHEWTLAEGALGEWADAYACGRLLRVLPLEQRWSA